MNEVFAESLRQLKAIKFPKISDSSRTIFKLRYTTNIFKAYHANWRENARRSNEELQKKLARLRRSFTAKGEKIG